MQRLAKCAVGMLTSFAVLAIPQAYSLSSATWNINPVPYYVNPNNDDVSPSAAIAAVRAGAAVWSDQSSADIRLSYAGRSQATTTGFNQKNEVLFRPDSSGNTIAVTRSWWFGDTRLDSDVVIYDASRSFFTGTSGCSGGWYIEDVTAHEFGHVLGLRHSDVAGATMRSSLRSCSTSPRSLHADDIDAIEAQYPPTGGEPEPPAPPSNLTASLGGANPWSEIDLSWNDQSHDEDGFIIQRKVGDGRFRKLADTSSGVTSFTDSNVIPETTYAYRVRAYNGEGRSAFSNTASQTTDPEPAFEPDPPSAPSSLSATLDAAAPWAEIDLRWNDTSNNEDGFVVQRSATGSSFQQLVRTGPGVTSYNDSTVTPGTRYWYRVKAFNANGDSGFSNTASATTETEPAPEPDPVPPSAPSGLTATLDGAEPWAKVHLNWTDTSSNESGFSIQRASGSGYRQIAQTGANVTGFTDSSVAEGTTYSYRIRSFNAAGTSSFSDVASLTTATRWEEPETPGAPPPSDELPAAW